MKRVLFSMVAAGLALMMVAGPIPTAEAGQTVEIRLKDGSRWRGQVDDLVQLTFMQQRIEVKLVGRITKATDLYVIVEGNIAGELRQKTIFRDDIVSMLSVSSDSDADDDYRGARRRSPEGAKPGSARRSKSKPSAAVGDSQLGVFVLPLDGMVGMSFRHEEIKAIGEKADEYGPGQIIVLLINTDGGMVLESQAIDKEIQALQKRHRVVAWVKKAISAGCQTAMTCQEIYFMTEGSAGAVTTWDGVGNSIKGDELEQAMEHLAEVAERNGYSEHIARAMKTNSSMCSYDKDPVTGEVTFYGDMSGEYLLSDDKSNLSFSSSTALHCGFSKGTADSEEELAKLLDLPEWYEVTDYGRKIADKWMATVKRAREEIPRLQAEMSYKNASGDAAQRIGTQIKIYQRLMRWLDRCPNVAKYQFGLPERDYFEREIAKLRKELADMRR